MSYKWEMRILLVLIVLFALCVGGLVRALYIQSQRPTQNYTITIEFVPGPAPASQYPADSKGDAQ